MTQVGSATYTRQTIFEEKNPSFKEAFMALNALHRHSPLSILHGNPFLPNLIISSDEMTLLICVLVN